MKNLNTIIQEITAAQVANPGLGTARDKTFLNCVTKNVYIPNPFKDLPNVKRAWIRTNVLDPLLERFGLTKRLTPELEFEVLSRKIRLCNRYLQIMHYRLVKFLTNGDLAGF